MDMKRVFLKAGLMMLAIGLLMACSSGNDIEPTPEEPKQELPEEPDPKDDPEAQDPEDPDSEIEFEDSMVVDMLPPTRAIELTQEQRAFVKKNNDFTFNFYRTLHASQQEKKSNVTSPLSVTYVMGMLNDGATGKTSEEITNVLGFGDGGKTALNAYCQALIMQAPLADPNVTLEMADIVAADDDVVFEDQYRMDMQDYYEAEVTSLDFSAPATLDYLNGWCNEKSHGMIPKIIDELSPEAKLVLMNAIYFKASWTEKFDENDTKEETFTKADGTTVKVPMMRRNAEIMYNANDVFSSVCLPFGSGDRFLMYVLLPSEGKTVDDVINALTNDYWEQNYKYSEPSYVKLKLPRFETKSDFRLNEIISQMGAPTMFDIKKAEFPNMSKNFKELYVSLLKQKAAIEVSEEGAKASAVTVAMMDGASGGFTNQADFFANRPFVYLIQEWDTKTIFFIGTYQGD